METMISADPAGDAAEESARLVTLDHCSDQYSLPEEAFDDLTGLASLICGTPIALVSLADSGRIWLTSHVRLTTTQISQGHRFCSGIALGDRLRIVPDAIADEHIGS